MKARAIAALVVCAGLACGIPDLSRGGASLEVTGRLIDELESTPAARRPAVFAAGAGAAGLVSGACRTLYEKLATADLEQRHSLLAESANVCTMACWGPLPDTATSARTRSFVAACDDAGVRDPVFGGSLATIRAGMAVADYLAWRHLFVAAKERLDREGEGEALWTRLDHLRPSIAMALDRSVPEIEDALITQAGREPWTPGSWSSRRSAIVGDEDMIRASWLFTMNASMFRGCMPSRGARAEEGPAGVVVELVTGSGRKVWSADVRSSNVSSEVEACVLGEARRFGFSEPTDGQPIIVVWPILLEDPDDPFGGSFGPVVRGGLSPDQVDTVVDAASSAFEDCDRRARTLEPELREDLSVQFHVGADGTVDAVQPYAKTASAPGLEGCVYGVFDHLRFPPPEGGEAVGRYLLHFTPG